MKVDSRLYEDLDGDESEFYRFLPRIKGFSEGRSFTSKGFKWDKVRKNESVLNEQFDNLREYNFTYEASRHESWWLLDSLGSFFDEQWFDDVLRIIKGGKEASVYLCQGNPSTGKDLLAAKIFRPRSLRNLRKDYIYREGRALLDADGLEIIDDRQIRAVQKRTNYGQELMHTSWIEHEYRTLRVLFEAGADVPEPYASDHNAILMDFIGDREVAAPTLNSIHLDKDEAKVLFKRVMKNVDILLDKGIIHGDLSAYNILHWEGNITLIDFPQAVNPKQNPNALPIFQRDIRRICAYFASQGVSISKDPTHLADDIWIHHGYPIIPNILLDDEKEGYDDEYTS